MFLEPGVAEDHALLPKIRDGKERPFEVGLITEDYIYHFRDLCHMTENTQLNNIVFFLFYIIINFSLLNSCCLLL